MYESVNDFALIMSCLFLLRWACLQPWGRRLRWPSKLWPANRKRDWAARAATCSTITNLLHWFYSNCHQSYGLHQQPQIILLWFIPLSSPSNTVLDFLTTFLIGLLGIMPNHWGFIFIIFILVFISHFLWSFLFVLPLRCSCHLHSWMFRK